MASHQDKLYQAITHHKQATSRALLVDDSLEAPQIVHLVRVVLVSASKVPVTKIIGLQCKIRLLKV